MKSQEIREKFLNFFEKKQHQRLASSSLIPANDPTLLFNNAGMNQFKDIFLGIEKPKQKRAATTQKCVRAGGKHNDLDNVGFTARHHTFFEMLGNFSFGDYFKEEAIFFAWEFLTEELQLPKEKLYITAFHDDKEAKDIWIQKVGIDESHFSTFGEKDNFWRMGDQGPCGPCSEIFYDFGPEMGSGPEDYVGGEGDRYIEIWNLVFMQFNESEKGMTPLKAPSIDTGMGLERISMVMQDCKSNYETDLFMPIIEEASRLSQQKYQGELVAPFRVLADHCRSVSFLIADGVLPSNEGRGYVLRRILRRAVRFNRKLTEEAILVPLCEKVIKMMREFYPELSERKNIILENVKEEEQKFLKTLDHGENLLADEISQLKKTSQTQLKGSVAFKLYDTFGFPVDLTKVILKEQGLELDEEGFEQALEKAKEAAKSGSSFKQKLEFPESLTQNISNFAATSFKGYDQLCIEAKLIALYDQEQAQDFISSGQNAFALFDQSPFYAESGGQIADGGWLKGPNLEAEIIDVQKLGSSFVHVLKVTKGEIKNLQTYTLQVDTSKREAIAKNHSATHLLHAALIQVCGAQVQQAGSLVSDKHLRFDFNHKGPLSSEQLLKVEELVLQEIEKSEEVTTELMSIEQAKAAGAQALFGEKYDAQVRVLTMGDFSKELCGGTHVKKSSDIFAFKILSETGVSSGVRRIEAVTSFKALKFLNQRQSEFNLVLQELKLSAKASGEEALSKLQKLQQEIKDLKKKLKNQKSSVDLSPKAFESSNYGKIDLLIGHFEDVERNDLREISDQLRSKMPGAGLLIITGTPTDKGYPIIVARTAKMEALKAGDLLKQLCSEFGGKGGGRPDFAQGNIEKAADSEWEKYV